MKCFGKVLMQSEVKGLWNIPRSNRAGDTAASAIAACRTAWMPCSSRRKLVAVRCTGKDLSSSGPVVPRKQAWLQASTSPTMVLVNVSGLTCIDNVSPAVSPPPPPPDPAPPKSSFAPVLDESPQHFMGMLQQLSDEEHPHPEGSKSNDS